MLLIMDHIVYFETFKFTKKTLILGVEKRLCCKYKKRLYLIFQFSVFKHLLNSLFVKNNFLQQSPSH